MPGGVLQYVYNRRRCWGAPQHYPSLHKIWGTSLFRATEGWGRGISCLRVGDARAGHLHALGSPTWCSLRKGKLRQHEML